MNDQTTPKILFISHEANRSGAPIVLLHFLRYLSANTNWIFSTVLCRSGELSEEFAELGAVYQFYDNWSSLRDGLQKFSKGSGKQKRGKVILRCFAILEEILSIPIWLRHYSLKKKLFRGHYDLIYSNTVVSGPVSRILSELGCPIITHVHELEFVILHLKDSFDTTLEHSTHYIAVSEAVKQNLVCRHNIPEGKVDVVHGCIITNHPDFDTQAARADIRKSLHIPQDAFVVGGAGSIDWRKGTDIYVYLADAVRRMNTDVDSQKGHIHFVWMGEGSGAVGQIFQEGLLLEVEKLGLTGRVHFVGAQKDPLSYYAAMDIFTLTSREDPYPLVCLEAASVGLPVLAFDKAGGMPEFIEEDCGFVVPYLNLNVMAEKILILQNDAALRIKLGKRAQDKVCSRHDVSVTAPKIMNIIEQVIEKKHD